MKNQYQNLLGSLTTNDLINLQTEISTELRKRKTTISSIRGKYSSRLLNVLTKNLRIVNVEELNVFEEYEILGTYGMGHQVYTELQKLMNDYNVEFKSKQLELDYP